MVLDLLLLWARAHQVMSLLKLYVLRVPRRRLSRRLLWRFSVLLLRALSTAPRVAHLVETMLKWYEAFKALADRRKYALWISYFFSFSVSGGGGAYALKKSPAGLIVSVL